MPSPSDGSRGAEKLLSKNNLQMKGGYRIINNKGTILTNNSSYHVHTAKSQLG